MTAPDTQAPDATVEALLSELAESPLPGARYAHHVVEQRLAGYRLVPVEEVAEPAGLDAAARAVADIAVGVCNDWMGDPDHGFVLDPLALAVDAYILARLSESHP